MRFISTKTHAIIDYLLGALLILSPWIFDFYKGEAESWVPIILGIGVILYSLFTNYEYAASRKIAMKTHLWLDILSGAFLAVSPWLFGFADWIYWPHLVFGIAEILIALCTSRTPDYYHDHRTDTTRTTRTGTTTGHTGHTGTTHTGTRTGTTRTDDRTL